ncbi:hypothetical protein GOP47_0017551 [Adiantum capillus-veneris]|uniref:Cytochrome P450 n=1 Tax=Adiantum capillus-veneris TaxID=13818 RepID=A0A9D4UGG1_ADICA|nr:hypothetical protein GOP47_0017551 [Adiantum capillus-veneris]
MEGGRGGANVAMVDWLVPLCMFGAAWMWMHRWGQRGHRGPKSWPLIGCVVEQASNFDLLHDWLLYYFRRLATFSVPMMSINNTFTVDPLNVEHILKTNFRNYPKGELIHERFVDVLGDGIFNVDGEKWVRQRKVAVLEFSSSKLRDHSINAFRTKALKLIHVLSLAACSNQAVDLQDLFMRLTLDSICEVAFGVDPESLSPELPSVPFANAFDEANRLIIRRYVDIFWKVKRALNLGAEARLRRCVQVVDDFIYGVINTRRAELKDAQPDSTERADLLSRFMSLPNEEGAPYTDKHLRDVVVNFIIAGRDTTALTLSWLFSMLCEHPRVVQNILEEAKSVLAANGKGNGTVDFDKCDVPDFARLLTYQALNKMAYLHASITEALRLYPAVPLESKIAVSDDVFPDGTKIKAGNFVSYAPYAMGRLEYIWGPDVMEFKPERWLRDGAFQPQSPFKLTAFQAGPRMCLGKDSAYLQMKMTTLMLLKFFSFKLVDNHPLKYSMMVVLYMANGLKIIVSAL